ncbi:MAG: hemin uptake protein HemP [Candidatus Thiodiazotropha sp. (ex Gloverina cf. vestifex)]|nr:hemin uptake protein HemP [Candidatus Thiodiazotropha sp. (ex Gloverina cf. vestifex)]
MSKKINTQPSHKMPSVASSSQYRIIESRELMQGDGQIGIDHKGEVYHLRITRQGKLIKRVATS